MTIFVKTPPRPPSAPFLHFCPRGRQWRRPFSSPDFSHCSRVPTLCNGAQFSTLCYESASAKENSQLSLLFWPLRASLADPSLLKRCEGKTAKTRSILLKYGLLSSQSVLLLCGTLIGSASNGTMAGYDRSSLYCHLSLSCTGICVFPCANFLSGHHLSCATLHCSSQVSQIIFLVLSWFKT